MEESINLSNVTLYAVDCVNPYEALESLIISSSQINFGEIILFSDKQPHYIPSNIRFIEIPTIKSLTDYNNFILIKLNSYINSDFCLCVQSDGYIHNPRLWTDEFKQWDYIGAPWQATEHFVTPNMRVGNGGVSLRSKRLLEETSKLSPTNMNEDVVISIRMRSYLASKNIHIAPLQLASKFSVEKICEDIPLNPKTDCFAFHGKNYTEFHIEQNNNLKQQLTTRINNMSIIEQNFIQKQRQPSDINEHLGTLHEYAKKCETIAEMGVRSVVSSYAFALAKPKKMLCLDLETNVNVERFEQECKSEGINMEFVKCSSLEYELTQNYDLLFIDTLHTFQQLTKELELHHSKVNKYIIFHDTVYWGHKNENPVDSSDTGERGDTAGLVPALRNFLRTHPNWKEVCTYTNNNGLTIIRNTDNVKE